MDGLEFDGLNDLVDGLENAVSKYPDLAEASLKREQRDFKKDMIRETWSAVDKHTVVSRNGKKVQGGGKTVGFVAGRRIKEPVIERWHQEHAKRAEKMLEKIHEEIEK